MTEGSVRSPARRAILAPLLVWGGVVVATLLVALTVTAWYLPTWAPEWVARKAPTCAYAIRALEQENVDVEDLLLTRMDEWEETALPILRQHLEADHEPGLRQREVGLLLGLCDAEQLASYFSEKMPEPQAEAAALRFLKRNHDQLVACGVRLLADSDVTRRIEGAAMLAQLADARSIPAMVAHLTDNADVRDAVLDAMAAIGDPAAVEGIVVWVLAHPGSDTGQGMSTIDLMLSGPAADIGPLLRICEQGDPEQRWNAFQRLLFRHPLSALHRATVMGLAARDPSFNHRAVQRSIGVLPVLPPGEYLDLLRQGDERLRLGAAWLLVDGGDRQGIVPLLDILVIDGVVDANLERMIVAALPVDDDGDLEQALGHPQPQVRVWAVRQMGRRGLGGSVELLLAMPPDPDPLVRGACLRALAQVGKAEVVPRCEQALASSALCEQVAALRALGDLADPRTLPWILERLQSPVREVRVASIQALGCFHDPRTCPALRAFLPDPDHTVREAARTAIEQVSDDPAEVAAVQQSRLIDLGAVPAP